MAKKTVKNSKYVKKKITKTQSAASPVYCILGPECRRVTNGKPAKDNVGCQVTDCDKDGDKAVKVGQCATNFCLANLYLTLKRC